MFSFCTANILTAQITTFRGVIMSPLHPLSQVQGGFQLVYLIIMINLPPIRALEFFSGHVIFKPCYSQIYQLKTTQQIKFVFSKKATKIDKIFTVNLTLMPYPFSHFYIDINFGNILYSKEKRPGSPLFF